MTNTPDRMRPMPPHVAAIVAATETSDLDQQWVVLLTYADGERITYGPYSYELAATMAMDRLHNDLLDSAPEKQLTAADVVPLLPPPHNDGDPSQG